MEFRFTDFEIFVLLKMGFSDFEIFVLQEMGQEILNCMIEGSEG